MCYVYYIKYIYKLLKNIGTFVVKQLHETLYCLHQIQ